MAQNNDFIKQMLTDLKAKLSEEFDRNFERKAFFSRPWKGRVNELHGTVLMVKGTLRKSIRAKIGEKSVTWTSSVPYAEIHNEGGTITVTAKMKRFFWAKYYELAGKIKYKKNGDMSKTSEGISAEALFYKALALKKIGDKITIPQRRFIGDAPEVADAVKKVVDANMKDLEKHIANLLKQKK
jgi:phage gpG-like protein